MKIDAYTKVILTLIATLLIVLVVRSFQNPPAVLAQQPIPGPQHVIIDGLSTIGGGLVSIGFDGLPVHETSIKIQSFPGEPVVIKGVDLPTPGQPIPVYIVNPVTKPKK